MPQRPVFVEQNVSMREFCYHAYMKKASNTRKDRTAYAAFLRGINVGGNKLIPMKDLTTMLEKMGFENVKTFIQSGNAVFVSTEKSADTLERAIEAALQKTFGFDVTVMIRTIDALRKILKDDPFDGVQPDEMTTLYAAFLSAKPSKENIEALLKHNGKIEHFSVKGNDTFCIRRMKRGDRLKLAIASIEKILGVRATVRNMNTVRKMAEWRMSDN